MGPVGIETIAGVLVTIIAGKVTPLSCYVGLAAASGTAIELAQPNGSLGCEYDIERIRLFVEHQSSPADGGDSPGFNHAGVKVLQPIGDLTAYAGTSIALQSPQHNLDNPLVVVGVETNGDFRLYAEHINSIANPSDGQTALGIKIIF